MRPGPVSTSAVASTVVEEKCIGCGTCVLACAYGAVTLRKARGGSKAAVDPDLCRGDGLCSSLCATGAIALRNPPTEEILRQIDAAFGRA